MHLPEGKKLIKSICLGNNSYLLMNRAYEDDKSSALAETHGFHAVVPPKKIINSLGHITNNFTNNTIILSNISFV